VTEKKETENEETEKQETDKHEREKEQTEKQEAEKYETKKQETERQDPEKHDAKKSRWLLGNTHLQNIGVYSHTGLFQDAASSVADATSKGPLRRRMQHWDGLLARRTGP